MGAIHLPPELFEVMDKEVAEVGMWFSLHENGNFFPLPDGASENDSVSTPIISATVGGQKVQDLKEPIMFSLHLLNKQVIIYNWEISFHIQDDTLSWKP